MFTFIYSGCGRGGRGLEGFGGLECEHLRVAAARDALDEAGQDLARATFDDHLEAGGRQRRGRRGPAHGTRKLADQQLADVRRVAMLLRIDRTQVTDTGSPYFDPGEFLRELVAGRFHEA